MNWTIVGLGNPGSEYASTRHNVGKELVAAAASKLPRNAKLAEINVYMNNSGAAIRKLVSSKLKAQSLVVVHDELDLPLGKVKISYGSSAGGHRGVQSIEKALKTRNYVRVRVGISPSTTSGRLHRPPPEKLADFVLGTFRPPEREKLKKVKKIVVEALKLIVTEGKDKAMSVINAG